MVDDRFELFWSKEDDIVAIKDKVTGRLYHTLEDIIDFLNLQSNIFETSIKNNTDYEERIKGLITDYGIRVANSHGAVITGDVYKAKLSVLHDLLKK